MSLRIWTYVNLDAFGDPANAGTYFDPTIYNIPAGMSHNTLPQLVRDGTERIIDDPQFMFPVRLNLSLSASHIDLKSGTLYNAAFRRLGPVLYLHKSAAMWIVLFHQSSQATSQKCYLCRIFQLDPTLAGYSTISTDEKTYGPGMEPVSGNMEFLLYVDRDGIYTNLADVTSGTYHAREPAS